MIESPTDAAAASSRLALGRDLGAHALQLDRLRGQLVEASGAVANIELDPGHPGGYGWQGMASRAFGVAARVLSGDLVAIEGRVIEARRLVDAATYEVDAGV